MITKPHARPPTPLAQEMATALRSAITKPARSYARWLEEDVILPDGPFKNLRFRFDRQPITRLWADAIDSGLWSEFICTAPSQWGKSLVAFVGPALYHICELRENYILGVPYADMASNKWEADLNPVMKASPSLRRLLPKSGSGSAGGRVRDSITFAHGPMLKIMGAGSGDQGKAGFTSRALGITEAAGFSDARGTSVEADSYRQLLARQRAFEVRHRRSYCEGTVTVEDDLPWRLRDLSTQSTMPSPCPHCGDWIQPGRDCLSGWEDARSDREAMDLAFWCCPSCGEKITEEQRRLCLQDAVLLHRGQSIDSRGNVIGDLPDTLRLWFRAEPWHNLLVGPSGPAVDEWRAAQLPDDSPQLVSANRELHQFVWCIPFVPPKFDTDLDLDPDTIAGRRLDLPQRVLPDDTELVTIGVDLGGKTGWYLVLAERSDGSRHIVDYGSFDVPSSELEVKQAIFAALQQLAEGFSAGWSVGKSGGSVRTADSIWVDSNFNTDAVLAFTHSQSGMNRRAPYLAAYGRGSSQMAGSKYNAPKKTGNEVREIDPRGLWYIVKVKRAKTHAVYWDSDTTKYLVQQALTLQQGTAGSVTVFAGTKKIHERLARHFTNERLVTEHHALRGEIQRWHRTGDNHLLDCLSMAWRAADRVRTKGRPTAADATPAANQPAAAPPGATPAKPAADWYGKDAGKTPTAGWYS